MPVKRKLPLCQLTLRCYSDFDTSKEVVPFRAEGCKPSKAKLRQIIAPIERRGHYDGNSNRRASCDIKSFGRATAKHKSWWRQ